MYSSRQAKILSICLVKDDYVTYQEISELLQISARTIRREIDQIKSSLQNFNLNLLTKKGKGICIVGKDEDKQNFIMHIQGTKIDYMDKEERQELLCLELLRTKEIQKLFYYSNKFQVSEATISHDLDDLETFFRKFHINLLRKPGIGIGIKASESHIRQAISSIINSTVQHHIMNIDFDRYNIQDVMDQIFTTQNFNLKELLNSEVLMTILEVFKAHHQELELDSIAKSSYIGLLIHLMIAIIRIQEKQQLVHNQEIIQLISDHNAYEKAKLIVNYLSEAFQINIDETECVFIAIYLQSVKTTVINQNLSVEEYNDVISKMLNVFKKNGYDLYNDYELYQSLSAHLKPALVRMEYDLPIYNPMLQQIQNHFSDVFNLTKLACNVITEMYNYELNDDEVGYLALHFAASIERNKITNLRPIKVGIICSSGIGLSSLLIARLRRVLDQNVYLFPLSISDVDKNECELLISTFDIDNAIFVTPLLNQDDILRVLKAIEGQREKINHYDHNQMSYDIIGLTDMVKSLIKSIKVFTFPHNYSKEILINQVCQNVTTHPLLKQQILQREEKGSNNYPNYGFVLLHVSTELVEDCLIHIIRPDQEVFTGENLEDIKIVLFMLIPQNSTPEQKQMMSFLSAQLIEDQCFYKTLLSGSEKSIYTDFHKVLQNWLIQVVKENTYVAN